MKKYSKKEYKPPVFIGQNLYIKPNYIVSIPEFYNEHRYTSTKQIENQVNLLENERNGKLSRKAIQGLRNSINWLCLAAQPKRVFVKKSGKTFQFKVSFITLTLPDTLAPISSSLLQKQLLNPWLVYMRKMHNLKNYVWRIEFQANGKLHVHITCDTFIHHKIVRETWNRLLKKHGHLQMFYEQNGNYNPNSTDIHATKKIKNLAGYLAKYMSKKNSEFTLTKKLKSKKLTPMDRKAWYFQRVNFWNSPFNPRPVKGRIWSCNYELSQANKCKVHIPSNECSVELRPLMNKKIRFKQLFTERPPTIQERYCSGITENVKRVFGEIYFLTAKNWLEDIRGTIYNTFEDTRLMVASLARNFSIFELN